MNPHSVAAMGNGSFLGEVQQGPDGELYEWVEGIDGFGNSLGFWKAIRVLKSIGRTVGKSLGRRVGKGAGRMVRMARSAGLFGVDAGDYAGELRQDLDGQLYEWVEGVDGLGNPVGFWKAIKAVGRGVGKAMGRARPCLPGVVSMIPGVGPYAAHRLRLAKAAGLYGAEEDDWTT